MAALTSTCLQFTNPYIDPYIPPHTQSELPIEQQRRALLDKVIARVQEIPGIYSEPYGREIDQLVRNSFNAIKENPAEVLIKPFYTLNTQGQERIISVISTWISENILRHLRKNQVDSYAEYKAKQARVKKIKEEALAILHQDPEYIDILEHGDLALVRASFGDESQKEMLLKKFWQLAREEDHKSRFIEAADEYIYAIGDDHLLSLVQSLVASAADRKVNVQELQKTVVAYLDATTQDFPAAIELKFGSAISEEDKCIRDYSAVQLELLMPSLIKAEIRILLKDTASKLETLVNKRNLEQLDILEQEITIAHTQRKELLDTLSCKKSLSVPIEEIMTHDESRKSSTNVEDEIRRRLETFEKETLSTLGDPDKIRALIPEETALDQAVLVVAEDHMILNTLGLRISKEMVSPEESVTVESCVKKYKEHAQKRLNLFSDLEPVNTKL
jgi:hypothetical protein